MAYRDKFQRVGVRRFRGTPDLTTVGGLAGVADNVGLGNKAQNIINSKGENPKEIFSGGFISDVFDVLNSIQYGIVGVLKGKGFSEGVRTRQSFSDKDALGDNGIPGFIGGILLDIAVDPLTYIAPWTIFKRFPSAVKITSAIGKTVRNTAIGKSLGRAFIYQFGADPVYKNLAQYG